VESFDAQCAKISGLVQSQTHEVADIYNSILEDAVAGFDDFDMMEMEFLHDPLTAL
jgi:hypothetical protein